MYFAVLYIDGYAYCTDCKTFNLINKLYTQKIVRQPVYRKFKKIKISPNNK